MLGDWQVGITLAMYFVCIAAVSIASSIDILYNIDLDFFFFFNNVYLPAIFIPIFKRHAENGIIERCDIGLVLIVAFQDIILYR